MRVLVGLYDRALVWAQHPHAFVYLLLVSFAEASFFPIPPYIMLAPMALAKPHKAVHYAIFAALASVCGATFGYFLGLHIFKPLIMPVIDMLGYSASYEALLAKMQAQGALAVFIAGFMPIPFKLVAITAGFLKLNLFGFIVASLFGRGGKFLIVALLMKHGGDKLSGYIRNSLESSGIFLLMLVAGFLGLRYFGVA